MRIAILTDIHSNLPAFEAVLESIEKAGLKERWCLGDVVGYGAQPDQCVAAVREQCRICLVGNHDLAVIGEIDTDVFSAAAAEAVQWTRDHASKDSISFLSRLSASSTDEVVALYHASPRDPVWEYVLSVDQAAACIEEQAARVSVIGHSHVALFFTDDRNPGRGPGGAQAEAGRVLEIGENRWLLNPGSVGQPRDGDPRAAWLELDTDAWTATYHRVEYEIDRAAEAIVRAGLPHLLADRLYLGQ